MNRNYYINGNTVREISPAPVRHPEHRETREEKEERRRKKNRRNAARRNRERALHMNRGYVAFLTICVAISAYAAVTYVQLQANVASHMRNIANLQSQVTNLRADNDARYKAVSTSVDLNYVKDVAMNQLGMRYATEEQIIYYSVDNSNFMDQYSDIPEK